MAAKKSSSSGGSRAKSQAKAKASARAKSGHGGARSRSGPLPKEVKVQRADLNQAIDDRCGELALSRIDNLVRLGNGGYERVSEVLELATSVMREEPACLVMRTEPVYDETGRPRLDPETGRPITIEVPAYPAAKPNERVLIPVYPDAKPGHLVVIRRTVETADGDRAANEYVINRYAGRPKQAVELSGPDGGAIAVDVLAQVEKIYGEPEDAQP